MYFWGGCVSLPTNILQKCKKWWGGGGETTSELSKYKFDFSEINKDTPIKTGEKFSFKITLKNSSDGKIVDDIDDLSVDLHVMCGGGDWEELQSGVSLNDGELEFTDLVLKQEYAGQACNLKVATKIDGQDVVSTFTFKTEAITIPEIEVETPDAPENCANHACVAIADTAKVGALFAITYKTKAKVSKDTTVTFSVEDKDGNGLADALRLYDDSDSSSPTLSKQVQAVLSAGQDTLTIKAFTLAGAVAEGKVAAKIDGPDGGQLIVKSSNKLAANDNALVLAEAYVFSNKTPVSLRLKVDNGKDDAAQVFTTRNGYRNTSIAHIGATAFSSSVATPVLGNDRIPNVVYDDRVTIVAKDGRVAARGVQMMRLVMIVTTDSANSRIAQGKAFSATVTFQTCVYVEESNPRHCTDGGSDAVGKLVTIDLLKGHGELLQWDSIGAITATLGSNYQATFNNLFFTTAEKYKRFQASMMVYGFRLISSTSIGVSGVRVWAGTTIIDQVVISATADGFTFKSKHMGANESFEYYFLKRDGTKSGSVERLTFGNDVMNGYRLAYLTPSDREFKKLDLANVCYKKMVVKAGDKHQLITQDFGKC